MTVALTERRGIVRVVVSSKFRDARELISPQNTITASKCDPASWVAQPPLEENLLMVLAKHSPSSRNEPGRVCTGDPRSLSQAELAIRPFTQF